MQSTLDQLLIIPFLVLICFPIARHFGSEGKRMNLRQVLLDKRNLPLLAGLVLNVCGVERPAVFSGIVRVAVYLGTVVSGFAVGLLFKPSHVFAYKLENVFSIIYRSTLYPLFFFGAVRLFNLDLCDTLILILILFGIVPGAIFSNVVADFFRLDKDLANSVYMISTVLFLVAVLPVYLFIVRAVI